MGGSTKKERNYYTEVQKEQNAALSQPTWAEARQKAKTDAWDAWMAQPGHDIGSAPGMDPYLQIGRAAVAKAGQERHGTGALQLASAGGEGYAQKLKEMNQRETAQEMGAQLENAYAMRNAEVEGSVLPVGQMELSRKLGQLGNTSQMAGLWIQKPRKSFWDYAMDASQMAKNFSSALNPGAGGF